MNTPSWSSTANASTPWPARRADRAGRARAPRPQATSCVTQWATSSSSARDDNGASAAPPAAESPVADKRDLGRTPRGRESRPNPGLACAARTGAASDSRPMLARTHTFTTETLQAHRVTVEVDIRPGLPAFVIVGLADAAVREASERVRAAIRNCG